MILFDMHSTTDTFAKLLPSWMYSGNLWRAENIYETITLTSLLLLDIRKRKGLDSNVWNYYKNFVVSSFCSEFSNCRSLETLIQESEFSFMQKPLQWMYNLSKLFWLVICIYNNHSFVNNVKTIVSLSKIWRYFNNGLI